MTAGAGSRPSRAGTGAHGGPWAAWAVIIGISREAWDNVQDMQAGLEPNP
jgi:hypothetical protein